MSSAPPPPPDVHGPNSFVDLGERHRVRDHRVDLDLAVHIPVDDLGYVGTPTCSAEGRALPDPPRNKRGRTRRDLGAGWRNANDDADAPAAMAGLERLTHHGHVAGAVESVVGA